MGNQDGTKQFERKLQEVTTDVQWRVLRSLPCFLDMSSQILCIYLEDRVTASNFKYFMMDLAFKL